VRRENEENDNEILFFSFQAWSKMFFEHPTTNNEKTKSATIAKRFNFLVDVLSDKCQLLSNTFLPSQSARAAFYLEVQYLENKLICLQS
jgi:hypothetical protein